MVGYVLEIIETYWNVNCRKLRFLLALLRNNRNILECKSWKQNP